MFKIGMVNTGLHGYLYASCFGPYNRYEFLKGGGQLDIMESASVPVIPFTNTQIEWIWDPDKEKAEQFAIAFGCKVAENLMMVAENVDGIFIADTSGDGSDHADIAIPFLENGIPVCIDKPLANSTANAKKIIEAAQKSGTPVFSSSLIYYTKAVEELKAEDLGDIKSVIATGGGSTENFVVSIHTFAALQGFMGAGIISAKIVNTPKENDEVIRYLYEDGRIGIIQMNGVAAEFRLDVYGTKGIASRENPMLDFRYGAIKAAQAFVKMLETKEPPISYDIMLEAIAALEAGRISIKESREVCLSELLLC